MNNSFFIKKLKFYQWSIDFLNNVCDVNVRYKLRIGRSRLLTKLVDTLFLDIAEANIYQGFLQPYDTLPLSCYFCTIPKATWNPYNEVLYFFNEKHLNYPGVTQVDLIYESFGYVYGMWYWFPECIAELKKYYPVLNIEFDEREFTYIDFWIKVLPVFEDLLGQLLINDAPLMEVKYTATWLYIPSEDLKLQPPLKENIDFSKHLELYYFGEGSHPAFLDVMTLYLDNRLDLKKKCQVEWANDIASKKNVSNNLTIYFVCNYLIKNISQYTLRFVAANTFISEVRPLRKLQNEQFRHWNNYTHEQREAILKKNRDFLLKKQKEKKIFEETGVKPKPPAPLYSDAEIIDFLKSLP